MPATKVAQSHACPQAVLNLVERYDLHIETYRQQGYNETQVRREFIDPLFEALGWDMDNKAGHAEAYKDIIHEDAIKVGGSTKAPDYCFRIGGVRKFFVEAKKPAVSVGNDPGPAYQLRRYAWSNKLPLSILTDFEEFAVYDCRIKPDPDDKSSTARVLLINSDEYEKRWGEIETVFSKDAVLKGSFDKFAESNKRKRGTAEVDDAFLEEIENWRDELARNIALRNPNLSVRDLNYAVGKTIDRIIFLRMCEDRGVETYAQLRLLLNGPSAYPRLVEIFYRADERYNSGLFHFEPEKDRPDPPDNLTPNLVIDDKVLKDIIKKLYYPECPYEFSVMPPEILGQVYEQFLGKVITLTAGHRAKVEYKPEVKKAGGVYYTPKYIVDYIVEHTVGKLLAECKTPNDAAKLRILDPACGSGSFLLGAYQCLLDWHLKWYSEQEPEKWAKKKTPPIYQVTSLSSGAGRDEAGPRARARGSDPAPLTHGRGSIRNGNWRLTITGKKRILLANIYGVDIDAQAVEVTKLSLLLKVLEGENAETVGHTLRLFHERALPDLGDNIKCGNSLIGPDFYDNQQLSLLDDEERYRINAFDWNAEFPEIMRGGGFNALIGNPPYIFTREQITIPERQYFARNYRASWEKHNTFMLFMENIFRLLCKDGIGSFIVPNSWLTIESGKLLRSIFAARLRRVADLNYTVFEKVSMEPCVFVATGSPSKEPIVAFRAQSKEEFLDPSLIRVSKTEWTSSGARFVFASDNASARVIDRIVANIGTVGDHFDVRSGLQAYERGKGTPPQTVLDVADHVFDRKRREDNDSYQYLQGEDVARYDLRWSGMWMQYGAWLAQPRELAIFTRPRVLLREITGQLPNCLHATFSDKPYLNNKSILNVLHPTDDRDSLLALLAILNSRLLSLYYKHRAVKSARKLFPKVVIRNLREFPFPKNGDCPEILRASSVATQMLDLHKRLAATKTPSDKTAIQRQIGATDRQIDQLVYQLYGLTNEEIKMLEETTHR